jgi:hypothetical protein
MSWFAQLGRETMAKEIWELEERKPTERELLFAESRKRFDEDLKRLDNMILTVVKAQMVVERFMIELLEAHGRDPKHFFFTGQKITECEEKIDPPEVGQAMWELLSLCSHVRNELVHSFDNDQLKAKSDKVREAYLAVTENERQKQGIREMTDTQMVTSAIYDCGSLIMMATEAKVAANKKRKG